MLKALELVGFKSFADKTRFDFPPGITVVVGPNGSGKSNVVDAIKWVLGEQSAKSLRGKDMADVIFKGGGSGRRPLNTAEATIIFDNSDQRLPIDESEVHVTRRVFRSGEGEYLINRKPCRLKDIRDLFRGTGVGVDAYSLIEQGKVDRLLQASALDRRAIFEEAAGISRFKAKKVEAQRRLARVDQNLMRLSDIVDEVENRLKTVRAQASKARRYREHSERLQELRTHVGWSDWRRLSERLEALQKELAALEAKRLDRERQAEDLQARAHEHEAKSVELDKQIRVLDSRIASCGALIARGRAEMRHHSNHMQELLAEAARRRARLTALTGKAEDASVRVDQLREQVRDAVSRREETSQRASQAEHRLAAADRNADQLRQSNDARRQAYMENMRLAADAGNRVQNDEVALQTAQHRNAALQEQLVQSQREWEQTEQRRDAAEQRCVRTLELRQELQDRVGRLREERSRLDVELQQRAAQLAHAQGRLASLQERAEHLQEIEQRLQGVHSGARQLLETARGGQPGVCSEVLGLVAELIEAPLDSASLIDAALGMAAQLVVVDGDQLLQAIRDQVLRLNGPVSLLAISDVPSRSRAQLDLAGLPGVHGRAADRVRTEARFEPLLQWLLGDVWLVDDLWTAQRLWRSAPGSARFVTADGSMIERSGAVVMGSPHTSIGLVSRRSELRAVAQSIQGLQQQADRMQQGLELARQQWTNVSEELQANQEQLGKAELDLAQLKSQREALEEHCRRLQEQERALGQDQVQANAQVEALKQRLSEGQQQLADLESVLLQLSELLNADQRSWEAHEAARQRLTADATAARVELARSEQRMESLAGQLQRLEEDKRERQRSIDEARSQIDDLQRRQGQAELESLQTTTQLSQAAWDQERLERQVQTCTRTRSVELEQRADANRQGDRLRVEIRQIEQQHHQLDLDAGQVRHQCDTLVDRLREEYGVEITQLSEALSEAEPEQREHIEQEIADLRRKIHRIGPVNMEALDELDSIEHRYQGLAAQFEDLREAKLTLEKIIQRINGDSRRLFVETLEAIRGNFQALFRQAFGGGQADIVLEENADVLEAGVEILATPPGKPSFSNTLLSGGEKALTAVALLLAIFQFRPSPFCILDEVDAPFDEANISRFLDVLNEFLGWTKFVVVTHSKKTMTAANTLYGVTMQESGVSKKVSVRFEEVGEDGRIQAASAQSGDGGAPAGNERGVA